MQTVIKKRIFECKNRNFIKMLETINQNFKTSLFSGHKRIRIYKTLARPIEKQLMLMNHGQ